MSDPTQNPPGDADRPRDETDQPAAPPPPPPPPPGPTQGEGAYGTAPPPPDQGGYGTTPPPPGGWSTPPQQPGAMPPPGYQPPPGAGQPADLWPRFAARLVDYVLLTVVNMLIGSVLVVGMLQGSDPVSPLVGTGGNWALNAVTSLISAVLALGYFTIMETKRGQTVGKMLLNLETRGPGGGRPTTEQALKRNAFTAIGVLGVIPFLGFVAGLLSLVAVIMIAVTINQNTATRQGWHDNFAGGTMVVRRS